MKNDHSPKLAVIALDAWNAGCATVARELYAIAGKDLAFPDDLESALSRLHALLPGASFPHGTRAIQRAIDVLAPPTNGQP